MFNKFKLNSLFVLFIILSIIFTPLYSVYADASYEWVKPIISTLLNDGKAVVADSSGNVYSTGYLRNTTDFDPGLGTANLTSAGRNDIFISNLYS